MSKIIQELESEQMQGREVPEFRPGDTVVVQVKVKEAGRERLQNYVMQRTKGVSQGTH